MSLLPPSPSSEVSKRLTPVRSNDWDASNAVPAAMGTDQLPNSGFDILGPLQRRKYLVALFCLIGAGLGYLHYIKTPKTYMSGTRLLVSTQAPPSIIDGDMRLSKVSLGKHASMIFSEMILSNAAVEGKFDRMKSFENTSFPVAVLKESMVRVTAEKGGETLLISCAGPDAEDLPVILNQIVNAYREEIIEDDQTIGQETIDLIQKLASKVSDEKEGAEEARFRLWKELGIQSVDNNGNVVNPHNKRLYNLQDQMSVISQKLRETQERAKLLASSLKTDAETGIIDPIQVKVAAIEAQTYLKLVRAQFKEEEIGATQVVRNLQSEFSSRNALRSRAWALETKIGELEFEKTKLSSIFGPGHKRIVAIDEQLQYESQKKDELDIELERLEILIEQQSNENFLKDTEEDDDQKAATVDLSTFRAQEDREWISMYQLVLNNEQAKLVASLDSLKQDLEGVSKKAESVAEGIVKMNLLQRKIDEKSQAASVIMDRLQEMNVLSGNYTRTKVKVLDQPKRGRQIAPVLPKSIAIGSILAFLAGLGLAILVDRSEMAFRNPHEILANLQIPVVGRIPRINIRKIQPTLGHASLVAAHKPNATASESFRDVRTGLFFRTNTDDIKTIWFTSPSPGDGKSTTIANMAISIAQAGKRCILVDADFRRPRVHQYFGEELNPGLLDILSGEKSLRDVIQPTQLQENLFLLTTGGRPKNPGELVTSEAFRDLIEALRDRFDYVLIDSPPVLPVADPATIASLVDAVYLVTRIRKGVKLTAQKAKETLDRVGANWMGVIVNGIDENPHYSEYGYQYGSYSYYGGYGRYGRYGSYGYGGGGDQQPARKS